MGELRPMLVVSKGQADRGVSFQEVHHLEEGNRGLAEGDS